MPDGAVTKGKNFSQQVLSLLSHVSPLLPKATHTHTIHIAGDQPTTLEMKAVAEVRKGKKQKGSLGAELPLFYGADA